MANLALRYPGSSFHHGELADGVGNDLFFGQNLSILLGSNGGVAAYGDMSSLYVAPSRYSNVRRLAFWACFRHVHNSAETTIPVRLRIQPYTTHATLRDIASLDILPSTTQRTDGTSSAWPQALALANEGQLYQWPGTGNTINARRVSTAESMFDTNSRECQLIHTQFDRFEASDAEFFADWDEIAAEANDDKYVAYRIAIERMDSLGWVNTGNTSQKRPEMIACGFTVVQAPGTTNDTCTLIVATPSLQDVGNQPNGAGASFFGSGSGWWWPFTASDWDGITAVHVHARQMNGSDAGGLTGRESLRVYSHLPGNGDGFNNTTILSEEDLTDAVGITTGGSIGRSYRYQDIKSLLIDGESVGPTFLSRSTNGLSTPIAHFEVIQKACTKKATFFMGSVCWQESDNGGPNAPVVLPPTVMTDKSLFDPLWYENLTDDLLKKEHVYGNFKHLSAGNAPVQEVTINADPDVEQETDPFTQVLNPGLSATPTATPGHRFRDDDIVANSPIRLAGIRTLKTKLSDVWEGSATFDRPGGMGLMYTIDIPNAEFISRGPLFDIDAFNSEGCAATSAGLGDPGMLVITNGSTIPKHYYPPSGLIENNGVPKPFEEEDPVGTPESTASSPVGGLEIGIYKYRYTLRNCCTGKESDPSFVDVEVDTAGASPAAKITLSFAGVRFPGDSQICEICIYRTAVGGDFPVMAKVGCFDPELTDIFIDTVADSQLDFLADGLGVNSLLNAPMPCVPIVVEFGNHLWGMGDIPELAPAGTVSVELDSDIITGDGNVEWNRCLEGKNIQIEGDCRFYEILRVLPPEEGQSPPIARLRLVDEYEGATQAGNNYVICGRPNRIYISEPFEPECWPEANFIDCDPGDGDRIMGAVSNFNRLVICKRNKTYVVTFRQTPALEINFPTLISKDIGCIGPRSFAQVASGSVWLSDRGLALYDGRSVSHLPASDMMNNMFVDPDNDNYVRRDANGRVLDAVGVFYPKREQYLLLLPTKNTTRGANVMLVWDTSLNNITLLKFCQEFQSMVVAKDTNGNERVYLGDVNGFVWVYDVGKTDGVGVPNATGTVKGTLSLVGTDSGASILEDGSASFIVGGSPELAGLSGVVGFTGAIDGDDLGMAGACVFTRAADAGLDEPWVTRFVFASTKTRLYVTPPFDLEDEPAAGYDYMIGAIDFKCVFKPKNYSSDDMLKRDWGHIVVHEVAQESSSLRVEILPDFQASDPEELSVVGDDGETGAGRIFDMSYPLGRQRQPVGRLLHAYEAIRMTNFAPEESIRIINHSMLKTARQDR